MRTTWSKSIPIIPSDIERYLKNLPVLAQKDNDVRLNSATGYITPKDMLAGRQQEIHAERDRRLEAARNQRQIRRRQSA